jgi:hypothetical protein
LPPLKNVTSAPVIFINQWSRGVRELLELTNHYPVRSIAVTCYSVYGFMVSGHWALTLDKNCIRTVTDLVFPP